MTDRPRGRSAAAAIATTTAAAVLLAVCGCGGAAGRPVPAAAPSPSSSSPSGSDASGSDGSGAGSPGGQVRVLDGLPAGSSLVATAGPGGVPIARSPAGAVVRTLAGRTAEGSALVLLVLGEDGDWLRVQVPERPGGSTAWLRQRDVTLTVTPYRLVVRRAAHRLDVVRAGIRTASYPVGIGTSVTPTPAGTYFLTELLAVPDPGGPYGPYAFGLSAFSPTLTSFAGGPGQLGLHGTDEPATVGTDVSHGCLRVTDDVITRLAREIPVGSPLEITR